MLIMLIMLIHHPEKMLKNVEHLILWGKQTNVNYSNIMNKKTTKFWRKLSTKFCGMLISYFPKRCSPILTTSPAPIVINKSPGEQLSSKKFSISLKLG